MAIRIPQRVRITGPLQKENGLPRQCAHWFAMTWSLGKLPDKSEFFGIAGQTKNAIVFTMALLVAVY